MKFKEYEEMTNDEKKLLMPISEGGCNFSLG